MKCIDIAAELSLTCYADIEIFLSKVTGSHSNIYNGVMGELETFSFRKKKKKVCSKLLDEKIVGIKHNRFIYRLIGLKLIFVSLGI